MDKHEMAEAARLERNRYAREWRAKNKDKVQASNKRYWETRAARKTERQMMEDEHENIC